MSPEMLQHSPEIASLGLLVIGLAFSKKTRDEIKKRAGGVSEISGTNGTLMHAMHLNHTKDETYDSPERGLFVTILEHLNFHRQHIGDADSIGLTEDQNNWSISMLIRNITNHEEDMNRLK